jgi:hypothetical protein
MIGKLFKWAFFGFVGLMVLAYFIGANMSPEEKAAIAEKRKAEAVADAKVAADQAKQAAAALETVTAAEITKAYDGNTVAADQKYKGKTLKIKGTVSDIATDFLGNPYVTMKGGVNEFMEPQFKFPSGAADQMAKLKKGQAVTFVCTGAGDVAKTPMLDDCSMVE